MPEMSQDVSGRQQVLRFLRHTASDYDASSATAAAARGAAAGGSGSFPKGRVTSVDAEWISVVSCGGCAPMGTAATPNPEDRGPVTNPAGRPSSAASHQPSHSETRLHLGHFPCAIKSPSPVKARTAASTVLHRKGRFRHASRRAGRDHGL
jgi:hypothetical protein